MSVPFSLSPTRPPRVPPKDSISTPITRASGSSMSSAWWLSKSLTEQHVNASHESEWPLPDTKALAATAGVENASIPVTRSTTVVGYERGRTQQLDDGSKSLHRNLSDRVRQLSPSKRLSPTRAGADMLKLAPSPNPNVSPTHRSAVEAKNEDKFLHFIRNGGSVPQSRSQTTSVSSTKQLNAHNLGPGDSRLVPSDKTTAISSSHSQQLPERPSATSPRKSLPSKISLPQQVNGDQQSNPRKKLLQKLGLGAPVLKPNAIQIQPHGDPNKDTATGISGSAGSSYNGPLAHNDLNTVQISASTEQSGMKSESNAGRDQDHRRGESLRCPEPRLRILNQRISSGASLTEPFPCLKFYDGDIPPTPPSKSKRTLRAPLVLKPSEAADNSIGRRHDVVVIDTQNHTARVGGVRNNPMQLVQHEDNTQSVYGALSIFEDYASSSPTDTGRNSSSHRPGTSDDALHCPSLTRHYRDTTRIDQGRTVSRNEPPSSASTVPYAECEVQTRHRDASGCTSASVPIFYDRSQNGTSGGASEGQSPQRPIERAEQHERNNTSEESARQLSDSTTQRLESLIASRVEDAVARHLEPLISRISSIEQNMGTLWQQKCDQVADIHHGVTTLSARIDKHRDDRRQTDGRLASLGSRIQMAESCLEWLQSIAMQNRAIATASNGRQHPLEGAVRNHNGRSRARRNDQEAPRSGMSPQQLRMSPLYGSPEEASLHLPRGYARLPAGVGFDSQGMLSAGGRRLFATSVNAHGGMLDRNPGTVDGNSGGQDGTMGSQAGSHYYTSNRLPGTQREEPDIRHHPYYNNGR